MSNWYNQYKIILAQDTNDPLEETDDISKKMDEELENPALETLTPEDFVEEQKGTEEKNEDENIEEPKGFPEFGSIFQAIRWAKTNHQIVRINYRTLRGNIIVRDIEPHGDFFAQTTHRRSTAVWDDTIGDIRTYILDNIIPSSSFPKGYVFIGKTFSPKFNFSRQRKNLKRRNREKKMRKGII